MDGLVFAKTDAGLDEIQQRKVRLHPRARSLLILVDGKQPVDQLRGNFSADASLLDEHLRQLQDAGLIHPVFQPQPVVSATGPASSLPAEPAAAAPFSEQYSLVPPDESSRLMALYRIYTDLINTCFASRPGAYQKELNKALRIGDYIALGNKLITALNQSERVALAVEFKRKVKPLLR